MIRTRLLRLLFLILIAGLGGLLYSLCVNLLIIGGLMPEGELAAGFGHILTQKAVMIWIGATLLGFGAIFLQARWRYLFFLAPLYAPSLFAVIYTMMQGS